jgi:DNA-binding transcriptional ArsR family regulator
MLDRPLTVEELAAALKERVYTINQWRRKGKIPAIDLGHRTKRYDLASVKAALLKRQVKARLSR